VISRLHTRFVLIPLLLSKETSILTHDALLGYVDKMKDMTLQDRQAVSNIVLEEKVRITFDFHLKSIPPSIKNIFRNDHILTGSTHAAGVE
jgi:hypothetical protein